jgi:hypothetical protein
MCFPISNSDGIIANPAHFVPNPFLSNTCPKVSRFYAISRIQDKVWIRA